VQNSEELPEINNLTDNLYILVRWGFFLFSSCHRW